MGHPAARARRPNPEGGVFRVGLDSLPGNRRALLLAVMKGDDPRTVEMPHTVRDREIEELQELGILTGNPAKLTQKIETLLEVADVNLT